jgi:D-alanine-D-alanine ligase
MSWSEFEKGAWGWLHALSAKLRIAVIYSADPSDEGAVLHRAHQTRPWKSYAAVAADIEVALHRLGFPHVWCMPDGMELPKRLAEHDIHLAWLNTGGVQGYGPMCHAPAQLEMLGVPYVGHDPIHSCVLDDKHLFKRVLLSLGLRTAPFMTWDGTQGRFAPPPPRKHEALFGGCAPSFVVKPVSGRASVDVHFVESVEGLAEVIEKIHSRTRDLVLIERYLPGREYCVSVKGPVLNLGGRLERRDAPVAFSALERRLEEGERIFTSMDVKPMTPARARLLGEKEWVRGRELLALGRRLYSGLGLRYLVRLDIREDEKGHLYVLEANPKPDLKRPDEDVISLVSLGLPALGMSYEDLILSLLAERLEHLLRHQRTSIARLAALLD